MGAIRLIIIYALIVLNAATALYMERYMGSWYKIELVIIPLGLLASLVVMLMLAVEAEWSWPLSVVFFSMAIANLMFEFAVSKRYIAFLLALLLNLFGFLISILSIVDKEEPIDDSAPPAPPVETYDAGEKAGIVDETPKRRKGKAK